MKDDKTKQIRVWLSALPSDQEWVEDLAEGIQEHLRADYPGVKVEFGIPLADDELCILVATSEALTDDTLRPVWKHLAAREGRASLAISAPDERWPSWMEDRFVRLPLDMTDSEPYRVNLSMIISKYIGETENDV